MKRKGFIKQSLVLMGAGSIFPLFARGRAYPQANAETDLVKEFVVAGHKDLPLVRDMLTEYPELLHASHHWGNGDWETALEGAAHTGNLPIVKYLIEQGARANLFVLTMMGKEDLVIPVLDTFPAMLTAAGPHGFSLLHHARVGGKKAQPLLDYLLDQGITQTKWI